jgi:hypothetical protein
MIVTVEILSVVTSLTTRRGRSAVAGSDRIVFVDGVSTRAQRGQRRLVMRLRDHELTCPSQFVSGRCHQRSSAGGRRADDTGKRMSPANRDVTRTETRNLVKAMRGYSQLGFSRARRGMRERIARRVGGWPGAFESGDRGLMGFSAPRPRQQRPASTIRRRRLAFAATAGECVSGWRMRVETSERVAWARAV